VVLTEPLRLGRSHVGERNQVRELSMRRTAWYGWMEARVGGRRQLMKSLTAASKLEGQSIRRPRIAAKSAPTRVVQLGGAAGASHGAKEGAAAGVGSMLA
jgi:hypothetical protein